MMPIPQWCTITSQAGSYRVPERDRQDANAESATPHFSPARLMYPDPQNLPAGHSPSAVVERPTTAEPSHATCWVVSPLASGTVGRLTWYMPPGTPRN